MSRTPQQWDALLSLTLRSDGAIVLTSDGSTAHAREINLSTAFTATYDGDRRRFEIGLNVADGFALTDVTHGTRGHSTDGTDDEAKLLHTLALPGVEGHAGFLSHQWATNLDLYTGADTPTLVGTFGIAPPISVVGGSFGVGPIWVESTGKTATASPRAVKEDVGIILYDGAWVTANDGGSVYLPDGTSATHPYSYGSALAARVDASKSLNPVTIVCPTGHTIGGGAVDADYIVAAGSRVTIESAGDDSTWAIIAWTV